MKASGNLVSALFLFISSASISHAEADYNPMDGGFAQTRVRVKGEGCIYVNRQLICNPPRDGRVFVTAYSGQADFDTGFSQGITTPTVLPSCHKSLSWDPAYGDVYFWPETNCVYSAHYQKTDMRYPNGYIECIRSDNCGDLSFERVPNPYPSPNKDLDKDLDKSPDKSGLSIGATAETIEPPASESNIQPSNNDNASTEEITPPSGSDTEISQTAEEINDEQPSFERRRRSRSRI